MAEVTICSDFGAKKKIKSATVSTVSPSGMGRQWSATGTGALDVGMA